MAVGDPQSVSAEAIAETVFAALNQHGQMVVQLEAITSSSKQDISRATKRLGERITREGKGVKGDPYKYSRNAIHPSTNSMGGGMDETNQPGSFDLNVIQDPGLEPFPAGIPAGDN